MSFDEALAVLLGWLGRNLEVSLSGAEGQPPLLAAELHGYLRSGDELTGGSEPANSIMFVLGDENGEELSTFVLAKDAFRSAGWLNDQERVLEVNCGAIQYLISSVED